jgi:hypothetical protein
MLPAQTVSIYLNNALRPTPREAELEGEQVLPEVIRDMPDSVAGKFVTLEPAEAQEIAAAWKKVMMLNRTEVLYTFTFDPETNKFAARKR